jgi:gamma-glutamyltranspeptidase/glutathione hydrolase
MLRHDGVPKSSKHGRDLFYEGELARQIVAASDAGGGYLTASDLAAQHCEWVEPISADYRGYRVMEMPPNGQGIIVLLALRILAGFDIAALSRTNPALVEHLLNRSSSVLPTPRITSAIPTFTRWRLRDYFPKSS